MDDNGAEDWDAVRVVSCTKCIPHTLPHTHIPKIEISFWKLRAEWGIRKGLLSWMEFAAVVVG